MEIGRRELQTAPHRFIHYTQNDAARHICGRKPKNEGERESVCQELT
ncbi:hypothetical protein [Prevotella dentasini]|nr:hypothetical protein [Prevotella dentasini]